eukprot:scaffold113154_cov35-Tisochrysis_lutea.AAC.2
METLLVHLQKLQHARLDSSSSSLLAVDGHGTRLQTSQPENCGFIARRQRRKTSAYMLCGCGISSLGNLEGLIGGWKTTSRSQFDCSHGRLSCTHG